MYVRRVAALLAVTFSIIAITPVFGADRSPQRQNAPQRSIPADFTKTKRNVSLKDVVNTVEKSYRSLENVTVDFVQRSTLAGKDRELRADGQFFLKKTVETADEADSNYFRLMFRFDYFRPTRHEIVSNGSTLWMYFPESRKVIQSDISYVFNRDGFGGGRFADGGRAVNFLQGLGRISKDFQIHFSPQMLDMDGNYILELSPRRSMVTISKLFIVVDKEAVYNYYDNNNYYGSADAKAETRFPQYLFPVLSTTVMDQQGNTTTMEFSNVSTRNLFDALFDFMIPAGVQVERPPRR